MNKQTKDFIDLVDTKIKAVKILINEVNELSLRYEINFANAYLDNLKDLIKKRKREMNSAGSTE